MGTGAVKCFNCLALGTVVFAQAGQSCPTCNMPVNRHKAERQPDTSTKASEFKRPPMPYSPTQQSEEKDTCYIEDSSNESISNDNALRRDFMRSVTSAQECDICGRSFQRPCDLTKHEKTHSRPWKCPHAGCKYSELGWPTEKELKRHVNDKHSAAPKLFKCLFSPCTYSSKRESNCKQHMEKAHGWEYVRSKSNGSKLHQKRHGKPLPTPRSESRASSRSRTPLTPLHQHEYPNTFLTPTSGPPDSEAFISAMAHSATAPLFPSEVSTPDVALGNDWAFGVPRTQVEGPSRVESRSGDHDFVLFPQKEVYYPDHTLDWDRIRNDECFSFASSINAEETVGGFEHRGETPVLELGRSASRNNMYQPKASTHTLPSDSQPLTLLTPDRINNAWSASDPFPNGSADSQKSPKISNWTNSTSQSGQATTMSQLSERRSSEPSLGPHGPPRLRCSRMRTKVGCLTCRKRRIKCGEERPACTNCTKSKRSCEGYSCRVVFKPLGLGTPAPHDGKTSPQISAWMADTYTPSAYDFSHWYDFVKYLNNCGDGPMLRGSPITNSSYEIASLYDESIIEPTSVNLGPKEDQFWQHSHPRKRQKHEETTKLSPQPSLTTSTTKRAFLLGSRFSCERQVGSQTAKLIPKGGPTPIQKPIEEMRRYRINSALLQIENLLPAAESLEDERATKDVVHSDSGYESSQASSRAATMEKATEYDNTLRLEASAQAKRTLKFDPRSAGGVSMEVTTSSERDFPSDTEASGSSEDSNIVIDLDWTGHVLDAFRVPAVTQLLERLFSRLGESVRTCHVGGGSGHASSSGGSRGSNDFPSKRSKVPQKRKADDYERDGGDEDEGDAGTGPSTKNDNQEPEKLLACPFCKFNPRKYRGCHKYTLRDISRVKQHLRRCHGIPKYCPICYSTFSTEKARDEHIRSRNCQQLPPVNFECVSEEQRKLLEQRVSKARSTVENWYTIYEILFPGAPRPDTPYVEVVLSEQLCELQDFTASEGPQIINGLIQAHLPPRLRPQEPEVVAFTQTLFQDAVTTLLERWETNRSGAPFNERSFTSATQSEASPELSRMPLPPPNPQQGNAQPQNGPPRQGEVRYSENSPDQARQDPGLPPNYQQGFDPSPPTPAHVNPGEYLASAAPRMVPNLSNGSYQPQTPDSGYRSGSSGNAMPGPSRAPMPTSSPFMGYDGSFDNLPGLNEFVDDPLLWFPARSN